MFENLYFGKPFLTKDGCKVLYMSTDCYPESYICHVFQSENGYFETDIYDGITLNSDGEKTPSSTDIISEYIEPIVLKCQWNGYYDYRIMLPEGKGFVRVTFLENETIISDLYVDEKHRRKGYGTILLNKADELIDGKPTKIVPTCNWVKEWYEKRGYIITK